MDAIQIAYLWFVLSKTFKSKKKICLKFGFFFQLMTASINDAVSAGRLLPGHFYHHFICHCVDSFCISHVKEPTFSFPKIFLKNSIFTKSSHETNLNFRAKILSYKAIKYLKYLNFCAKIAKIEVLLMYKNLNFAPMCCTFIFNPLFY